MRGEPRQLVSLRGQLRDWRSAIRFAREHPRVAPEHVALWGSSLSGGHVQHLAARDHTIAACIAQAPFALGLPTALAGGLGHAARIIVAAWRDLARQATGREPYRVELFGAPGSDAVMATAEAHAALATLLPPTSQWEQLHYTNSVPARSVRSTSRRHSIERSTIRSASSLSTWSHKVSRGVMRGPDRGW